MHNGVNVVICMTMDLKAGDWTQREVPEQPAGSLSPMLSQVFVSMLFSYISPVVFLHKRVCRCESWCSAGRTFQWLITSVIEVPTLPYLSRKASGQCGAVLKRLCGRCSAPTLRYSGLANIDFDHKKNNQWNRDALWQSLMGKVCTPSILPE